MRISDWSSDVCSSDLLDRSLAFGGELHAQFFGVGLRKRVDAFDQCVGDALTHRLVAPCEFVTGLLFTRGRAIPFGDFKQALSTLGAVRPALENHVLDRKSTRLNSSH